MTKKSLLLIALGAVVLGGVVWPWPLVGLADNTKPTRPPDISTPSLSTLKAFDVVRVADGDTIFIEKDGKPVSVRLIGVDTPETQHPNKPVEEFGTEASAFVTNLLKGEQVYLVIDEQQGETDRYGRLLAYVYRAPDGLFVNAEIIRQGYGHAYTRFPFRYADQFRQLEAFAREAGKGMWANAEPAVQSQPAPAAEPKPSPAPAAEIAEPPPTVEQPAETERTVYITRTGKKYHRGSCGYLRQSKIPIGLSKAKAQGYTPCSRCKP